MMREAFKNVEAGVMVEGHLINKIRVANDKAVLASTIKGIAKTDNKFRLYC